MIKYDLKDQQFLAVVRNTILYVQVTGQWVRDAFKGSVLPLDCMETK